MAGALQLVIVDESQRTLDNLERLLRFEADIQVVGTASNPKLGMEVVRRLAPDVVLVDLGLFGQEVKEMAALIKEAAPSAAIVASSVALDSEDERRALAAGIKACLPKPFSADRLVSALREAAGREPPPAPPVKPKSPDRASGGGGDGSPRKSGDAEPRKAPAATAVETGVVEPMTPPPAPTRDKKEENRNGSPARDPAIFATQAMPMPGRIEARAATAQAVDATLPRPAPAPAPAPDAALPRPAPAQAPPPAASPAGPDLNTQAPPGASSSTMLPAVPPPGSLPASGLSPFAAGLTPTPGTFEKPSGFPSSVLPVITPPPGQGNPSAVMPAISFSAPAPMIDVPSMTMPVVPPPPPPAPAISDLSLTGAMPVMGTGGAGAEQGAQRVGQITVVWSGKGGVGKTTMAINMAAVLAEEGLEVALVDLDLQFGDVGVLLGAEHSKSISAVVSAFPAVDAPLLGSLMPETPFGIRVLAAPISPELADLVTPVHVRTTIELLRDTFEHVVVDCSSHLGDAILEAVELATHIVLVTDLDIHSIKEAKLSLKLLERLSVPTERIHLVCNRLESGSNISVGQMEASLRFPVAARIPANDKLFRQSISRAAPLVHLFPDSDVTQRVREFVGSLVTLPSTESRQGGRGKLRFWPRSTAS